MARAKLPNGLTPKQETFALAFFKNGGNATQAYDTKSMSSKTVNECASRLVRDRRIAARLETLQRAVANRVEIKEAAILRNAYCAMMADPRLI